MAIQLIGAASTAKYAVPLAELGFSISSLKITVSPEVDTPLMRNDGHQDGAAIGDPQGELSMSGEARDLTAGGNVTLVNAYTAFAPVNATNYFGRSQGGWYFKSGSINFDRGGWATIDTTHSSKFNLA